MNGAVCDVEDGGAEGGGRGVGQGDEERAVTETRLIRMKHSEDEVGESSRVDLPCSIDCAPANLERKIAEVGHAHCVC